MKRRKNKGNAGAVLALALLGLGGVAVAVAAVWPEKKKNGDRPSALGEVFDALT